MCASVHVVICSAVCFEIQAFVIPVILLVLIAVVDGIKYVLFESERHDDVSGQKNKTRSKHWEEENKEKIVNVFFFFKSTPLVTSKNDSSSSRTFDC